MPAPALVVCFELPGVPGPMPRPRLRGSQVFVPPSVKVWKDLIAVTARNTHPGLSPRSGRFRVEIDIQGTTRGDIDNIAKTVLDGLIGVVCFDDRQVAQLEIVIDQGVQNGTTIVRAYSL